MGVWTTALVVGVLFVISIAWKFSRIRVPLLRAAIGSRDGVSYEVHYQELRDDVHLVEYVRLNLYFVANTLYILNLNNRDLREQWEELRRCLRLLADQEPEGLCEALSVCGLNFVKVTETSKVSGKRIVMTLGFRDVASRTIRTRVPMMSTFYPQYLVSSLALIQAASEKLDGRARSLLHSALRLMLLSYESGEENPRSAKSLVNAPRRAFNTAALGAVCAGWP